MAGLPLRRERPALFPTGPTENLNSLSKLPQAGTHDRFTAHPRSQDALLATVPNPREYNDIVVWPTKVEINLHYLNTWTVWTDIRCFLETVMPRRTT
jgi:hypothetical protein